MISCWKHKNFGIIGIVLKYLIVKPVRTGTKFLIKTSILEFKGQLISKCPFGVIVSTKIPTKKFDKFCPTHSRAEFVKFFGGILVQTMKPKGHFEINWPLNNQRKKGDRFVQNFGLFTISEL